MTRISPGAPSSSRKSSCRLRHPRVSWGIVLFLQLLFSTRFATADQPGETLPFFRPDGVFDSRGIDNINLFNGDTGVIIPLGPVYNLGPTTTWQLRAYNTAKLWHLSQTCENDPTNRFAYVSGNPTLGVGWTLEPGYIESGRYVGPDGTPHRFPNGVSEDGSHLRLTAFTNPTSYTVEFPDGSIHRFTHSQTVPKPTSIDFRTWDFGATAPTRYGLTEIDDAFGNIVLKVDYDPDGVNRPGEFTSITLGTTAFGASAPVITFTWTTVNNWRCLSSIVLPAPGGTQLKVTFAISAFSFTRNVFDLSWTGTCSPFSGPTANVIKMTEVKVADSPTADAITKTFSYFFAYYGAADPDNTQKQGALQTIYLPSSQTTASSALATITYDYAVTAYVNIVSPGCEPYTCMFTPHNQPELNIDQFKTFLDKTPGVKTRDEFDPFTNRHAVVYFDRLQFYRNDAQNQPDTKTFVRRTNVTRPGNDDGIGGAVKYVTQYFFHSAYIDDQNPEDSSGGVELERRYLDGNDPVSSAVVRDLITCWDTSAATAKCGFEDATGTLKQLTLSDRTPPRGVIIWYGNRPAGQDGGTCISTSSPECTSVTSPFSTSRHNPNYNSVAGHYFETTTFSSLPGSLPGGVNRTVETNWTASSPTQPDWLLDLYDHRFTWDGTLLPGGSNGQTIVREYFNFDSTNGFLTESWTWDFPPGSVIKTCRYVGSGGIVTGEYSQTYASPGEPTTSTCDPEMPDITADSDTFGKDHTWANLLLTKSAWRNLTGSGSDYIGWNSFDVVRDTNTGLISTAKDSNSSLTTTYTYDGLGRIIKIQPPGGSSVEWPTTMCYLPTAISGPTTYTPFIIVKKLGQSPTPGPNGTACVRDEGTPVAGSGTFEGYQYDGLGRLIREIRRFNHTLTGGSYFAKRESRYDSAGHRTFFSDWQPCPLGSSATSISSCALPQVVNPLSTPGPSTQFINFDPFGRTQQFAAINVASFASNVLISRTDDRAGISPSISFSDSKEMVTTQCVNGTWTVGTCNSPGQDSVTVTEKDALGRVWKVTEPDAATGQPSSDVTTYTYNVLDKVYTVDQGAHDRTFQYQAFGFLKSETTPENGSGGGATTGYKLYGSIGNLRTKLDPDPSGTTYNYSYDVAGRLTLLTTGTTSPFTQYLVNCYDGIALCGDTAISNYTGGTYPKGRLTRRVGWNQPGFKAAPVFDDFNYSASSGRLSSQITSIGERGTDLAKNGFGAPVTQSWTYNTQGLVSTHTHPRISGAATTLTINDSEYTSGLLTKITASGSSSQQLVTANYHESGRLSDYTTGFPTTVTTTIAADGVVPSRPGQISSSVGGFNTGAYSYDGAGNIKKMGASDTFTYDSRSRITQAKYTTPTQNFTYDRYGNILNKAGAVLCSGSACTNNRITGAAYDSRGNMTAYTNQTLSFDLLNRQYGNIDGTLQTDFTYLYDGAGERIGKFATGAGATRREFARIIIEGRGDTNLTCPANTSPFNDVSCNANPNDGKYIKKIKDLFISTGCDQVPNYCPDIQTPRDQAAVLFLRGRWNTPTFNYTPPLCTPPPNQRFADVPCPSLYADWIEELADEGITAGCGNGNYCPTQALGAWQMLAWAQKIWPTYYPLPRTTILTFRDEKGLVATESHQKKPSGDDTQSVAYERDNAFLGNLLISSVVWSGTSWTTPGWQFYSSDHLGSPRLTTNTSAATVETKKYWPYGDEASSTGNAVQRLKFTSMERDDETKHFYDHARTHDFNLGRFVSAEPVWLGSLPMPQSWNRYTYSLGNPLSFVDPNGKFPIAAVVIFAGGLFGAAEASLEYYGEHGEFSAGAAGRGFAKGAFATGGTLLFKNPIVGGAVVGGLFEAADEFSHGGPVSPLRVGVMAGIGAGTGGFVKLLGPRPGTFEAGILRWRGLGEYFAGRNVTRQAFSEVAGGAYETLSRFSAAAMVDPSLNLLGPGAFWLELMSRIAQSGLIAQQDCVVTPSGASCGGVRIQGLR